MFARLSRNRRLINLFDRKREIENMNISVMELMQIIYKKPGPSNRETFKTAIYFFIAQEEVK